MKNKPFLIFLITNFLFSVASNLVHPVTPTLIVERGLDSSMFGVAFAAMMFMYFLFSPFWGKLCNYLPSRTVFLLSAIGYAVGQILFGMAQTETMVIAGRMFGGAFCGGANTAIMNQVVNTSGYDMKAASKNLTTLVTVQSVASACGFFVGGMLGLISVETCFLAAVIMIAGLGVIVRFAWENDTPYKVKPSGRLTFSQVNPFSAFADARRFMTPLLFLVFAIIAVTFLGQYSYEQCFNYYIKDQYGMTSAYNGIFKAIIALLSLFLNSTICSWMQRKTDINKTFLYVLFALTGLTLCALIFKDKWVFIGVYILFNSVDVLRKPLLQSMSARLSTPETSNSIMGFYQSMLSFGSIFGSFTAGVVYAKNPLMPFILAFIAFVAATGIGIVYRAMYAKKAQI